DSLIIEIEKLKLTLFHKNELLEQKEKELEMLRKMISLLEK
ncbi:TPA: transcriptional regulator, partial [Haemophilus influenzae]